MSLHLLPIIIFVFAVLGIILIILRHLREAAENAETQGAPVEEKLSAKGLPAEAASSMKATIRSWSKRFWNFALEAKDLKPRSIAGYKIKKMFGGKQTTKEPAAPVIIPPLQEPEITEPIKDEQYFLDLIKKEPKNLRHYHELGKYYIDHGNIQDAQDIYMYLTKHDSANAEYHSKLAFCYYRLGKFDKSSQHYEKSTGLDSTQPNRYYNLGVSLEAQGKFEEAIAKFQLAISMEPKNIKYYITLSNAYGKTGNEARAKSTLLKAKKIDPENQQVLEKLEQFS